MNRATLGRDLLAGDSASAIVPESAELRGLADLQRKGIITEKEYRTKKQQLEATGSALMSMRNFLVPALRFSPVLSYFLILIGLIFNVTGLFWLGVLFYGLVVLFALLTLPVEIDASQRGRTLLQQTGLMQTEKDEKGTRQLLMATASTYLAAAITSLLQLFYYISIARRSA